MKLSLTLSVLILAGFGWLGLRNQAAITQAIATHEQLVAEARELGIGTDDLSGRAPLPRSGRSHRESPSAREEQARAFSKKLIDFALKMQEIEKSGKGRETEQTEILAVIEELLQLDQAQLKILVQELRASTRMDDDLRRGIVSMALMTLADKSPAAALSMFADSKEIVGKSNEARQVVSSALAKLAESDPLAAVDWIRTSGKDFSDVLNDPTRAAVLAGAAKNDSRLAFSLIDELGLSQSKTAASRIAEAAKSPAERSAVLDAMRDYIGKAGDENAKSAVRFATLSGLVASTVADGYDKAAKWLEEANLSGEETKVYVERMMPQATGDDSGKWITWMSLKLPPEDYTAKVGQIMAQWSNRDYRAAGSWLNDQPDGPAKTAAVRSYATNVAAYEPESAAQWALTLPAGQERTELLTQVYQVWQGKDAAAAEAFAKKQGLGGK